MTANGPKIQFGKKLVNILNKGERQYSHILQNKLVKLLSLLFTSRKLLIKAN